MASIQKYVIDAPKDPEVNINVRDTLEYYMVFPSGYNENQKYGLVFCISGYGETIDSEYYLNKLCTYISDKYNLICVGVRYHNDKRSSNTFDINLPAICNFYGVDSSSLNNINSLDDVLDTVFDILIKRGIRALDKRLAFKTKIYHKYSSFGFMPAIDHLYVLSNILKSYKIDKSNIIAFGTSYGGYIASLIAKYAPHTFSLVVDNSGFCLTQLQEVLGDDIDEAFGSFTRYIGETRYEIPVKAESFWSVDETSEHYFSDAHRQIRSLLIDSHRCKSATFYCCYHSVKDEIVPIYLKDKMYDLTSKYNPIYYKRVSDEDIDGALFKNTRHGMNASLRKMFDSSFKTYKQSKHKSSEYTDFDLGLSYSFKCSEKLYNFSYTNYELNVSIEEFKGESMLNDIDSIEIKEKITNLGNNEAIKDTDLIVLEQILGLIPTLNDSFIFIENNTNSKNFKTVNNLLFDINLCFNSISEAISPMYRYLPENNIDSKINQIKEFIIHLQTYKETQLAEFSQTLHLQVLPLFSKWENEVSKVIRPLLK